MHPDTHAVPSRLRDAGVTAREVDVFWLVGDRLHNSEIAKALQLSERTVESHVSSLLRKLGGGNRLSLVDGAAELRHRRASAGALPRSLSSFVGRADELGELLRLVSGHRLVTLTGPAGAGKTRLALQLARSVDALPPAVLVDLAIVAPGAEVERVFADALGIAEEDRRVGSRLRETLTEGRHWLVVDNCEHVASSTAALLADLLTTTPDLRILATSHGPLHIAGEVVYELLPLPLPPDIDDPAVVLSAAAGRLFADRAATAFPGFTVTADNARDVAAVCRGLDGLPLAIELAAARLRAFSPAELVANLQDRLALLADGAQGSSSRHRTLGAALQWSYDLLGEDEQLLFERCSVFPGDFDYDTLVELMSRPPLPRAGLAGLFPRLLDRSLVSGRREGQVTQYRMLDSIRHFAASQLVVRGEDQILREHHARYHLGRGAALVADLRGADQVAALAWFRHRWPDLRAAMLWALEEQRFETAWEFLAGVGTAWDVLGVRGELFDWLSVLLERPLPAGRLGVAAAVTASFLLHYQDTEQAAAFGRDAYDQAARGDDREVALALLSLGRADWRNKGDSRSAVEHLRRAVGEFERLGDSWHHALALEGLGSAEPDPEQALAHLTRGADQFGRLGDHVKRANCLNQMASRSVEARTRLDDAAQWLIESHRLAELAGNHHEQLHSELFQARLDQCVDEAAFDAARFNRLFAEFRRIGDRRCMSRCLLGLGQAALQAEDHDLARAQLADCLQLADGTGDPHELAAGLRLLAVSRQATGESKQAAVLLGAADESADRLDPARRDALPPVDELRVVLQSVLGAEVFQSALASGRRTSLQQLLAT